jgi:UDPglucose--hexose-1-phosphate uridylyltransferase
VSSKESIPLSHGIVRQDRKLSDGRTISYYDSKPVAREAIDTRPVEKRPGLGELRLDALTNEWVVMAAHRQARVFLPPKELCPLCPTKPGLQSEIPEANYEVAVFENLSPSLAIAGSDWKLPEYDGLNTPIVDAAGFCEVLCYTDQHEANFGSLSLDQIRIVMEAWRDRTREISKQPHIAHIFAFENRGVEIGVTLHHPHGQIYSYSYLPPRVEKMLKIATDHLAKHSRPLLTDIIAREIKDEVRIVAQNSDWIAYVPFASRYPFEIHIAPKVFTADLAELTDAQADAFGAVAKEALQRLDGVFGIEMAYMASWHQAPVHVGRKALGLHMQITSIRRAPGKLKYLAGSESAMQAFIMDLKPEQSAAQMRDVKI